MTPHFLVVGAGGYIGSRLVRRLLSDPGLREARFTFCDQRLAEPTADARARWIDADITEPASLGTMIEGRVDTVFHLAGILGGAAESDYALSRRVNVDATLALLERLRNPAHPPRVVFASSIAVYGPPLPSHIDDDTLPLPIMTYGAQKRMMEVALEQFSARGWIDGLALRLPGIVARRDVNPHLKSSFLNQLFYAVAAGDDFQLPVSLEGTTWLLSAAGCVEALLHAATLPRERLGNRRALTLPALRVRLGELLAALHRRFPDSPSSVEVAPDPALEAQFAAWPDLSTALADALGFRHDGDLDALVARAFER